MLSVDNDWFTKARAYGDWVICKEDKRVDHYGPIIFTDQLLGAERVGHSTSHIMAISPSASKLLGAEKPEELVGQRFIHRDYIKDAWKLGPNPNDNDKLNYFIIKWNEIIAFVDEDVLITSL